MILSITEAIQQFIQCGRATAKAAPTSGLLRFFQDCRRRREYALISCLSKTLSPEETAVKRQISRPFSTVDSSTPGVETPGYFQESLRDKNMASVRHL